MSFKGTAADTVRFLGDETEFGEILDKMNIIFATVSSFHVLIGNCYKFEQGDLTVPVFSNQIEGALSKVRQMFSGRISARKAQ